MTKHYCKECGRRMRSPRSKKRVFTDIQLAARRVRSRRYAEQKRADRKSVENALWAFVAEHQGGNYTPPLNIIIIARGFAPKVTEEYFRFRNKTYPIARLDLRAGVTAALGRENLSPPGIFIPGYVDSYKKEGTCTTS